ncbi:MAG: FUSC family protein [Candidatus Nitrosopolaris sp.]
MSQPHGKPKPTSGWRGDFLRSLSSFNLTQLDVSVGIRAGVLITVLLIIGVLSNHIGESVLAALGTINVSIQVRQETKRTIMIRTLILASIINASVFTIGSLIGTSYLAVPLFAIGLFIISYFGVYPIDPNILTISAVVFSIGVALPGINNITPGERFWLFLVGGLWGVLVAITSLSWQVLKKNSAIKVVKLSSVQAQLRTINLRIFHLLTNNMSLESERFQFAVCFAVTGTIGLLVAKELGLIRAYWVLLTICFLLRSDIYVTLNFTAMRIIGTIAGAEIAVLIVTNVHGLWFLCCILFVFASVFYAVRYVNYALATFFLTPFVLVLLLLIPGQILLAQTRVLDTIIGAGVSLLGVFIIRWFSYLKR